MHNSQCTIKNTRISLKTTYRGIVLSLCIMHGALCIGYAQNFHAGLLAGISTSQVDGDNLAGYHKVGIKGGVFVNRQLSEKFALQLEIEFLQKGSRKPVDTIENTFFLMRLNYIDVPLLAR